ncbi:YlcI/YnfO family protein [Gilliamella sp. WF3-4]|uniref:YlcI/YnfO family protein n=1 Tax=Gilliamella sp. WF3-4 TaxID=3120255 RepID=UPI00159ED57D|nr:YlcI/YnfO family protein [Gilliamella apicola]
MPTDRINNKSQNIAARVPHEIMEKMETVKEPNENTSQFIVNAMKTEIKRRKRKQQLK